jgi:hypothetical protein
VLGPEKQTFGLHFSMFSISIDLWSTDEQKRHWKEVIASQPGLFGKFTFKRRISNALGVSTYTKLERKKSHIFVGL